MISLNQKNLDLLSEARDQALRVLRECSHPSGIQASASAKLYKKVWARDSMITLLGAISYRDPTIEKALKNSILTLEKHQIDLGCIPNYVDTQTNDATFRAYADAGLWFVIGCVKYYKATQDKKFLQKRLKAIRKVLNFYAYQSPDQSGFITMDEAGDWEDIFSVRGKGLTINTLYYWALKEAAFLEGKFGSHKEAKILHKKAIALSVKIQDRFWYSPKRDIFNIIQDSFGMKTSERRRQILKHGREQFIQNKKLFKQNSFFLPYLTFLGFGEWFDSLGNILAILTGIASPKQNHEIINLIQKHRLDRPWPIKATWPPQKPGDSNWRHYFVLNKLNLPDQYHNGGAWPYLGGLYVAALIKVGKLNEAQQELIKLAQMCKKGKDTPWEFNEWFHGKSGKPMGMPSQAWSAGMYLYAYRIFKNNLNLSENIL